MRESVLELANHMELVLKKNDHKMGWSGLSIKTLLCMVKNEVDELEEALDNCNPVETIKEAVDVANFCMMIRENIVRRNLE